MRLLTRCAFAAAMLFRLLVAQQPTPAHAPNEPPSNQPAPNQPAKELTEKEKEDLDAGIPIASELVRKTCSPCHKADDKQRLSRISWRRTTPEGWEQTIKRMISLNELKMEPAEAREILKYLADNLGLAPEEARPAAFEV